jgi:hypothetical protein
MYFDTSVSSGDAHPYLCTITTHVNADGSEDVRIDQPVVDHSSWEYKPVIFSPGDVVTITADGCVQTAGEGATWKKYVNPSGSNSGPPNGFYWGSVSIPGATTATTPVTGIPIDELSPPGTNPSAQIFIPSFQSFPGHSIDLTLGYADDNYNDEGGNGYWEHDNGNNDQCANTDPSAPLGQYGGPAWVNLHIVHGQGNPFGNVPYSEWDLAPSGGLDANGLLSNPSWGWQVNGEPISTGGNYDLCNRFHGFPAPCSQQHPSYDFPPKRYLGLDPVCDFGAIGHRDWFDATYTGHVDWVAHDGGAFGDDDYNMRLETAVRYTDPAGITSNNTSGDERNIGLEFDSDETIDKFDQSPIWKSFHRAVDASDIRAGAFINGNDAVVTGLMGIDEMHSPHSEIHPVHALAIRENSPGSPDLANDKWMVFVRNWGDQGECSSRQHYLLSQQVTIQLPPPTATAGQATLNADTGILHNGGDGKYSFYSGPEGTFVTFDLPPGDAQGYQFGELDLKWDPSSGAAASTSAGAAQPAPSGADLPSPADVASDPSTEDPEQLLNDIWNAIPSAQQQDYLTLENMLDPPEPPPVSSLSQAQALTGPPQRPASMPGVADAPATAMLARDDAQWQGLCAATGGHLPIIPDTCSALNFPPVTTLTTSGGSPLVNGWYTTPVTATLSAQDASGSGIAVTQYSYDGQNWTSYTGPFTLPDGAYTFYYRSEDNKGNLEETRQQAFKIDTTPPDITISQPQAASYTHSSTLTLGYTVVDGNGQVTGVGAGSGVASVTATMDGSTTLAGQSLPSGQTINLLTEMTLGQHTFSVAATDNVGHLDSRSVTFFIIVTPQSIIEDVNQFYAAGDITQDEASSLLAKLQSAAKQWAAGDCQAATSIYQAFIDELQAQSGKHVDPTAASIMTEDAKYLIGHCP